LVPHYGQVKGLAGGNFINPAFHVAYAFFAAIRSADEAGQTSSQTAVVSRFLTDKPPNILILNEIYLVGAAKSGHGWSNQSNQVKP
jgi:hypothetical protein